MNIANTETISKFGPSGSLISENSSFAMAKEIATNIKKTIFFMKLY